MATSGSVIYDFGANNGDDIAYYLLKAPRVVAVEANPLLCEHIKRRFLPAVACGRLVVVNAALSSASGAALPFYIPKPGVPGLTDHHSTLADPDLLVGAFAGRDKYDACEVNVFSPCDIVRLYGPPLYIKVDIEHLDSEILAALFRGGICPPFISAEAHSIRVLCELVSRGGYGRFKLVDGGSVQDVYGECDIQLGEFWPALFGLGGSRGRVSGRRGHVPRRARVRFPQGSAGPFGDDLAGAWMSADEMFDLLSAVGLGWKDIHAAR